MKHFIGVVLVLMSNVCLYGQSFCCQKDMFLELAKESLVSDNVFYLEGGNMRLVCSDKNLFVMSADYIEVPGFQGNTNMGLVFDKSKLLQKAVIISSDDTFSYVKKIKRSGFLEQFNAYHPGQEVDAVSGATITSDAIAEIVEKMSSRIGKITQTLGVEMK